MTKHSSLVAEHRVAQPFHARLVLADGLQHAAEARVRDAVEQVQAQPETGQRHPVEGRVVLQVERTEGRTRRQRQPVVAAPVLHRDGEVVEHLREGERDHDEVTPRVRRLTKPMPSASSAATATAAGQATKAEATPDSISTATV